MPFGTEDCKVIMKGDKVVQNAPLCCWENCPFVHWAKFGFESNAPCQMGNPKERWKASAEGCWARCQVKEEQSVCQLRAFCYGSKD